MRRAGHRIGGRILAAGGLWGLVLHAMVLVAHAGPAEIPPRPQFRFHGALIRVTDMDVALVFYARTLGFHVLSDTGTPRTARLDGDFPLYLRQVPVTSAQAKGTDDGRDFSRVGVAFMTADIERRTSALRKAGVVFLDDAPHRVGVGLAIAFRDPFGTVHSFLQQTIVTPDPFEEPKVYNSGFYHPKVSDVRPLYIDTLGFVVRTEKYFPPALPLGHTDGSFAFMLHERTGLRPAQGGYPVGPGTTLIFTTPDVGAAKSYLAAKGIDVFRPSPEHSVPGGIVAFRDRYGVVSEIWPGSAVQR